MFWDVLGRLRTFWDILGHFVFLGDVLGYFWTFGDILGCFGTFLGGVLGGFEIFLNFFLWWKDIFARFGGVLGRFGTFWITLKSFRIFGMF